MTEMTPGMPKRLRSVENIWISLLVP
jgi:hypothetical protein